MYDLRNYASKWPQVCMTWGTMLISDHKYVWLEELCLWVTTSMCIWLEELCFILSLCISLSLPLYLPFSPYVSLPLSLLMYLSLHFHHHFSTIMFHSEKCMSVSYLLLPSDNILVLGLLKRALPPLPPHLALCPFSSLIVFSLHQKIGQWFISRLLCPTTK